MMNRKTSPLGIALFLSLSVSAQVDNDRTNYLVILLDDLGYTDFSCYGGVIPTPNIDQLAAQGVRMSQMYNTARSCPTRASILTGLYPQQAGVGYMTSQPQGVESKAYQGFLNKQCVTMGEVMSQNGYFTSMVGKWHVGFPKVTPWERGFQRSLNAPAGGFYFHDSNKVQLYLNGKKVTNGYEGIPTDWYSTNLWSQFALNFIDEAIQEQKPFMTYLAYNAPHFPLQAPQEEINYFKGKFSKGWDVLRQEIYQRQLAMGLLGSDYQLSKRNPKIPLWESLTEQERKQSERRMEIYAATVKVVDDNIGWIVSELKKRGVFQNTMIILLSDNGGNPEPGIMGRCEGENPGDVNSQVFLGAAWAEMCNTPFYMYKHHTHEGGISTPCIVSYPKEIPATMHGKIVHEPAHVIDVMATLVGTSASTYPDVRNREKIIPMQGINLMPLFLGKEVVRIEPLFWEHEGNVAVRDGKWKLVKELHEIHFQLYDMENDRTETTDLALTKPDIFDQMKVKYEQMFKKVGAESIKRRKLPWFTPIRAY